MFRMRVADISLLSRFTLFLLTIFFITVAHAQEEMYLDGSQYGNANLTLPQSSVNLEAVLADNPNYELLSTYNKASRFQRLGRPVGRLDILLANGRMTFCTASVVSKDHVITNAHCLPGNHPSPPAQASLLMNYLEVDDPGSTVRYSVDITPVEENRELDYSILRVEGDPAAQFGKVALRFRDPSPGEALLVIHHPAGLPKHVTRGGCRARTPKALSGNNVLHLCDTLPGSSGAPVFSEENGHFVGLHFAGGTAPGAGLSNFAKRSRLIIKGSRILEGTVVEVAEVEGPVTESPPGGGRRKRSRAVWRWLGQHSRAAQDRAIDAGRAKGTGWEGEV